MHQKLHSIMQRVKSTNCKVNLDQMWSILNTCHFVYGTMLDAKVIVALVNYTLSGDFKVTFWAWFGTKPLVKIYNWGNIWLDYENNCCK